MVGTQAGLRPIFPCHEHVEGSTQAAGSGTAWLKALTALPALGTSCSLVCSQMLGEDDSQWLKALSGVMDTHIVHIQWLEHGGAPPSQELAFSRHRVAVQMKPDFKSATGLP